MLQLVWFDVGLEFGWLLIMVYHFAIDAVSWLILFGDLFASYTVEIIGVKNGFDLVLMFYWCWV